ncbi:MAG: hypothetical protein CMI52_00590 [Parcubacteria group bacterium]|nr:hypothetical protein [Parcubacteria group bacterium]|tara:strand:- start:185 stop:841 length:657 start_codon:yes stop_codon:yes gene_type:complete
MSFVILHSDDYTLHFPEIFDSIFEAANACATRVQEAPFEYGPRVELLIVKLETLKAHSEKLDELKNVAQGHLLIERRGWMTISTGRLPVTISIPKKRFKKALGKKERIVIWDVGQKRKFCPKTFPSMETAANNLGRALKATPHHSEHDQFGLFSEKQTQPTPESKIPFTPNLKLARAIVEVITRCWLTLTDDTQRTKIILPLSARRIKKLKKQLNTAG